MAELNFEMLEEEPLKSFEPLAAGWYPTVINATTEETSKAGNRYLQIECEITGEFAGRRVWTNYNIWHPDSNVVEIAQRQISDLTRACGLTNVPPDSDELVGKHLDVQLKIDEGNGDYAPKNKVVAYRTAPGQPPTKQVVNGNAAVTGGSDDPPW